MYMSDLSAHDNGFAIVDEALVLEDHYYQIIVAEPGKGEMPEPLLLEVGPVLSKKGGELFRAYIRSLIAQKEAARDAAEQGGAKDRALQLTDDIQKLLALI